MGPHPSPLPPPPPRGSGHQPQGAAARTLRRRERLTARLAEAMDGYPQQPRDDADRWWVPAHRGGTAPDVATGAALDRAALERIGAPGA